MSSIQKQLTAHYVVTALLLGALLFYGFVLHRNSKYEKLLGTTVQLWQDSSAMHTTPVYDSNFKANIERELAMASSENKNWLTAFKKDSIAYPENVVLHIFKTMPKFEMVLEDMARNGDTVTCTLFVRDKEPFTVTAKFVQQGDVFLLDDLENISAFYKRLNRYNLFEAGN